LSQKKELGLEEARTIAEDFLKKTRDLYKRSEIAGSIRRKSLVVHDIDFAVIPSDEDFSSWKEKVKHRVEAIGGKVITFGETISDLSYKGVQVNLFLCPGDEAWGITLMWATGPKGHTIGMNIKAKNKGLLVNSKGIFTREESPKLIPTPTEQDVGRVLDWQYKPPEARGKEQNSKKEYRFTVRICLEIIKSKMLARFEPTSGRKNYSSSSSPASFGFFISFFFVTSSSVLSGFSSDISPSLEPTVFLRYYCCA
jgi:DNA polymerase beta thumb